MKLINIFTDVITYEKDNIRGFATLDAVWWISLSDIARELRLKTRNLSTKLNDYEKAYVNRMSYNKNMDIVINSFGFEKIFANRTTVLETELKNKIQKLITKINQFYIELKHKKKVGNTMEIRTIQTNNNEYSKQCELLAQLSDSIKNREVYINNIIDEFNKERERYEARIKKLEEEVNKYKAFKVTLKCFIDGE